MRRQRLAAWVVGLIFAGSALSAADTVPGSYHGDGLAVQIAAAGAAYSGSITLGTKTFPMTAAPSADGLAGQFTSGGKSFDFSANGQGDALTLSSGGRTYHLMRDAAAAPGGAAAVNIALPPGYQLLRSTPQGLWFASAAPQQVAPRAALLQTIKDVNAFLNGSVQIGRAYEDASQQTAALAGVSGVYSGQAVRGLVLSRAAAGGTMSYVAFCNISATPAERAALITTAKPADPNAPAAAAAKPVHLDEYRFPDNTGSIGLPDGYRTTAPSGMGCFVVNGPAGQEITVGLSFAVYTPQSPAVFYAQQFPTAANATMIVAPYSDPTTGLAAITPQVSRISQQNGGSSFVLDHLKKLKDVPVDPQLGNGQASLMSYGLTRAVQGQQSHVQVVAEVWIVPLPNQSWMFYESCVAAPDATFRQDLPTMLASIGSLKANDAQVAVNTQAWIAARQAWFEGEQKAEQTRVDAGDSLIAHEEQQSVEQSKLSADFDEVIHGHRTVEDSQTGNRAEVDLGNVNEIVDGMNEGQPGRYVQIPLRDQ